MNTNDKTEDESNETVNKQLKNVGNSFSVININSDSDSSKKDKYELTTLLKDKLTLLPEVLAFILQLQALIEKQRKKIQKLKLKKTKHKHEKIKYANATTQTSFESYDSHIITKDAVVEQPKTLAEEITEAAEEALQKTGFVYEETSGMYYDYNSGYYYNAEYGLYYDGNTGTYLKFNQDSQEYEFHSQVEVATTTEQPVPQIKEKQKKKGKRKSEKCQEKIHAPKRDKRSVVHDPDELEEGECSDSSVVSILEEQLSPDDDNGSSDLDYAKQYPPCMRIIIEETNIKTLKQGSLYLITYEGGTLGREGAHSILLPELNTSKHHLKFTFDKETSNYCVTDLGSRNGTILNGKRMSPSKMESEPLQIPHGSKIQIGGTIMLCHIHTGSQTCGHCEPGLIQPKEVEKEEKEVVSLSKSNDHREQLKQMRKKFGITPWDVDKSIAASGYTDRAEVRRVTVGSQNPYEKTKTASVNESIPVENKGFKLLAKMGWKEGESLGKDNKGLLEPVNVSANPGTSGMGNTAPVPVVKVSKAYKNKQDIWQKTRERYSEMPEKLDDVFEEETKETL